MIRRTPRQGSPREHHGVSATPKCGGGGDLARPADSVVPRLTSGDRALLVGTGIAAFAAYLLTLSRGVLGGDAGELQFVPPILGLTHPTGYPLLVLVHFFWSFLPVGSVAYRLNLLDAAIAAAAVSTTVALARAVGVGRAPAALAGLSLAFGELWWSQAVRGDKYTLNGLFLALVLLLFVRWRARPDHGRLALLAFVFGLSLTHHRSMLLVAPALAIGLLVSGWRPWGWRSLAVPLLLAAAPLLLYLYVPWAGGRGLPPGSWPVDSPAAFAEFLLDRGYTSQLRPDAAFGGRLVEEAWVLVRSFGPLGAVLGLLGLAVSLARDWRLGLVLLLAFVPQAVLGASYLLESNYQLPRHWVFYLPAFLIWAVWLGLGLDAALGRLGRLLPSRRNAALSGAIVAVLLVQAGSAWARGSITLVRAEAGAETMDDWRQDFQRSPVAERFGRLAFELALPNAIIVCDWEQATVLWYFQQVEGQRRDLTIRYPIERLDETLAHARAAGQTVYISRTLPGVESRGVTSSVGPLLRVFEAGPDGPFVQHAPDLLAPGFQEAAAHFDGTLSLSEIAIHIRPIQPGGVVPFTLYWRANLPLTEAYALSVRLLSPDGRVLAAEDHRHPALGTSPMDRWQVGVLTGDYHELPVGSRLQPGTYYIQVVPYRAETQQPLSVVGIPEIPGNVVEPSDVGIRIPIDVVPRRVGSPLDLLASLLAR